MSNRPSSIKRIGPTVQFRSIDQPIKKKKTETEKISESQLIIMEKDTPNESQKVPKIQREGFRQKEKEYSQLKNTVDFSQPQNQNKPRWNNVIRSQQYQSQKSTNFPSWEVFKPLITSSQDNTATPAQQRSTISAMIISSILNKHPQKIDCQKNTVKMLNYLQNQQSLNSYLLQRIHEMNVSSSIKKQFTDMFKGRIIQVQVEFDNNLQQNHNATVSYYHTSYTMTKFIFIKLMRQNSQPSIINDIRGISKSTNVRLFQILSNHIWNQRFLTKQSTQTIDKRLFLIPKVFYYSININQDLDTIIHKILKQANQELKISNLNKIKLAYQQIDHNAKIILVLDHFQQITRPKSTKQAAVKFQRKINQSARRNLYAINVDSQIQLKFDEPFQLIVLNDVKARKFEQQIIEKLIVHFHRVVFLSNNKTTLNNVNSYSQTSESNYFKIAVQKKRSQFNFVSIAQKSITYKLDLIDFWSNIINLEYKKLITLNKSTSNLQCLIQSQNQIREQLIKDLIDSNLTSCFEFISCKVQNWLNIIRQKDRKMSKEQLLNSIKNVFRSVRNQYEDKICSQMAYMINLDDSDSGISLLSDIRKQLQSLIKLNPLIKPNQQPLIIINCQNSVLPFIDTSIFNATLTQDWNNYEIRSVFNPQQTLKLITNVQGKLQRRTGQYYQDAVDYRIGPQTFGFFLQNNFLRAISKIGCKFQVMNTIDSLEASELFTFQIQQITTFQTLKKNKSGQKSKAPPSTKFIDEIIYTVCKSKKDCILLLPFPKQNQQPSNIAAQQLLEYRNKYSKLIDFSICKRQQNKNQQNYIQIFLFDITSSLSLINEKFRDFLKYTEKRFRLYDKQYQDLEIFYIVLYIQSIEDEFKTIMNDVIQIYGEGFIGHHSVQYKNMVRITPNQELKAINIGIISLQEIRFENQNKNNQQGKFILQVLQKKWQQIRVNLSAKNQILQYKHTKKTSGYQIMMNEIINNNNLQKEEKVESQKSMKSKTVILKRQTRRIKHQSLQKNVKNITNIVPKQFKENGQKKL